jgi:serine/threonine protein kinase
MAPLIPIKLSAPPRLCVKIRTSPNPTLYRDFPPFAFPSNISLGSSAPRESKLQNLSKRHGITDRRRYALSLTPPRSSRLRHLMSTLPFDERYEILSEIGRGGMGVVHAARDRISGAEVVIKTLLHKGESELTSWQRFEREARTLASLRHSSIVTIHDFGRNSQGPYMVMARIRGKDWQSVIQDSLRLGQPPDLALTLRVMGQVAQALSYCHSRDTVHRDLKPSNILVDDSEPGEERALLIDFGLVRGGQEQNQLTRTGELLGTPLYMAPELIDSDHHALAADSNWSRADVWAFGVSLYQSLTGKAPFQGAGAALLAQVAFATPEPISAINPAAPSWLIKLTLACIEKDSKLRPTMPEVELAFRNQSFNATKKNQRQRRLQIVAAILISLITLLALAILFIRPSSPPILIRIESPAISSVPNIQISGQSTSANLIAIRVMPGERRLRAEIDPDGLFQVPVLLSPGPNEISLRLQGPKGWSSPTSLTCIYDNQPPSLDLSETPTTIYGKTLELRASLSETKCRVRGLDQLENQSFSVIDNKLQSRLELHEGLNELSFLITDPAGWSVRASHRVDVRPSFTIGPERRLQRPRRRPRAGPRRLPAHPPPRPLPQPPPLHPQAPAPRPRLQTRRSLPLRQSKQHRNPRRGLQHQPRKPPH